MNNKMILNYLSNLNNNNDIFKQLLDLDYEEQGYSIEALELNDFIEKLFYNIKNYDFSIFSESIYIMYDGNPYTTILILLGAIIYNKNLLLNPDNSYIGINTFLCKHYNEFLKENFINNSCELIVGYNTMKSMEYDSKIYIGNSNVYSEICNIYDNINFIMEIQ